MNKYLLYLSALFFSLSFSSCANKDSPAPVEQELPIPVADNQFGKIIKVTNFSGGVMTGTPVSEEDPLLYSLEQNQAIPLSKIKTMQWDLSFGNIFKSFLGGNNGTEKDNHGFGNQAKGGILLLEKSFDEVVEIPADHLFSKKNEAIGTDDQGDFGSGMGWYIYDMLGKIVRDGSYDNQHIAYPLDQPLVINTNGGEKKTISPRTLVVKTAQGHYAKIRIISVYQNKLERDSWLRLDPKPFYTFEYILAKSGSKTFQ